MHPHEDGHDEDERQQNGDEAHEPTRLRRREVVVDTAFLQQLFIGFAQLHGTSSGEFASVRQGATDDVVGVVDREVSDFSVINKCQEFGVAQLLASWRGPQSTAESEHDERGNNDPDGPARHRATSLRICRGLVRTRSTTFHERILSTALA